MDLLEIALGKSVRRKKCLEESYLKFGQIIP